MNEAYKNELLENGVDVNDNMVRFMNNEVLFEKLLKMFLEDTSYSDMKEGFAEQDCEKAFKGAHSLKGVAANLGFSSILEILVPDVEILRKGNLDVPQADIESIDNRYQKICAIIKKYTDNVK